MKTIYSCLFILTFFNSCTSDSKITSQDNANKSISNRNTNELPGNIENPYDEAGRIHNELFESYYANSSRPITISGIFDSVATLAAANSNFSAIITTSYNPVSTERIQYILDHKNTCVTEIISNSSLTVDAKLSLTAFINSFLDTFQNENNCVVLYNYVATYEKSVVNNPTLTSRDKQIILITTSIARHTVYLAKKKPKKNTDPDWTVLIGHIMAAVEGAEYGMAESVTEALVTGIASN